jgi:hypothetical protein
MSTTSTRPGICLFSTLNPCFQSFASSHTPFTGRYPQSSAGKYWHATCCQTESQARGSVAETFKLELQSPSLNIQNPHACSRLGIFFHITSSIPQADSRKIFRAQQDSIRGSALKLQDWALYDVVASPVLIDFHLKLAPKLVRGSSIFNFEWNLGLRYLRSTFSQSL